MKLGDQKNEYLTLSAIGAVYSSTGQKQKALETHMQAFDMIRAAGDDANQANAINLIGKDS